MIRIILKRAILKPISLTFVGLAIVLFQNFSSQSSGSMAVQDIDQLRLGPSACGAAIKRPLLTAPAQADLCGVDSTPSTISGSGPWTWTCTDQSTNKTVNCVAPINNARVERPEGSIEVYLSLPSILALQQS